jgi:hypothetical protein
MNQTQTSIPSQAYFHLICRDLDSVKIADIPSTAKSPNYAFEAIVTDALAQKIQAIEIKRK